MFYLPYAMSSLLNFSMVFKYIILPKPTVSYQSNTNKIAIRFKNPLMSSLNISFLKTNHVLNLCPLFTKSNFLRRQNILNFVMSFNPTRLNYSPYFIYSYFIILIPSQISHQYNSLGIITNYMVIKGKNHSIIWEKHCGNKTMDSENYRNLMRRHQRPKKLSKGFWRNMLTNRYGVCRFENNNYWSDHKVLTYLQ